jgi:alanine-glyoxylate transaminase/serine-glyoxylate transaminase/serine-pyruvate transaminase
MTGACRRGYGFYKDCLFFLAKNHLDLVPVIGKNETYSMSGVKMSQEKLLLIPGPTPVHPRILNALSQPTISHVGSVFVSEFREALGNLKEIVFGEKGEPFVVSGAGTLAMEMALLNSLAQGEKAIVLSQGYFGMRMARILESFGMEHDVLQSQPGKAVEPERLKGQMTKERYAAVVVTHVDTATGVCAPVREYAEINKKHDSFFILDGVCATGGIEERMDEWGIDVILTAPQKCFGVPPGLAVSERVLEKRRNMKNIPAYYSDLLNWLPVMKDPSRYFSTPGVNEIRAFNEGTRVMLEEGMENRFLRHSKIAEIVREGLREMGFSFVPETRHSASTLSVILYPEGIDDKAFRKNLFSNGVVVAGGLGDMAGRVFRMGHMGNLSFPQVYFALDAVKKTLSSLGYSPGSGAGLKAAPRDSGENKKRRTGKT